jgi:hypothetical protein
VPCAGVTMTAPLGPEVRHATINAGRLNASYCIIEIIVPVFDIDAASCHLCGQNDDKLVIFRGQAAPSADVRPGTHVQPVIIWLNLSWTAMSAASGELRRQPVVSGVVLLASAGQGDPPG